MAKNKWYTSPLEKRTHWTWFSPLYLVSLKMSTPLTKWSWHRLRNLKNLFPRPAPTLRNLGERKGDYESMRKDTLEFAKKKYFDGHSDTRSVQENFDLLTSFIQDSADKHIPSKTSMSVSSIPCITSGIRRKIRRKNKTHAKAKRTGSSKLRSKFETLRREIGADVRKQHDLYVNSLVGDVKANPKDFYRYINSQKKDTHGIPPLKRKNGKGVAQSNLEKAEKLSSQFTDVFNKNEHTQVPLLDRSAPFMNDIAVSKDGVIKLLKGLNPSKALGPDELHPRVLKSPKRASNS